ncbi:MAG TPA: hypothetical protein VGR45_15765 [Stellaceae bacterium]|nr:hypothetical protein [Stellaceae bacterium]
MGLGALSTGTRADTAESGQHGNYGDVSIRSEGGRIFLLEGGRERELRLSATPQRDHLLRVLEEHGPAGIKLNADPRLIMSGSGGAGFSLRDIAKPFTDKPDPAAKTSPQESTPRNSPKRETGPRDRDTATDKKG